MPASGGPAAQSALLIYRHHPRRNSMRLAVGRVVERLLPAGAPESSTPPPAAACRLAAAAEPRLGLARSPRRMSASSSTISTRRGPAGGARHQRLRADRAGRPRPAPLRPGDGPTIQGSGRKGRKVAARNRPAGGQGLDKICRIGHSRSEMAKPVTDKPLVILSGEIKTPPLSREARRELGFAMRAKPGGSSTEPIVTR